MALFGYRYLQGGSLCVPSVPIHPPVTDSGCSLPPHACSLRETTFGFPLLLLPPHTVWVPRGQDVRVTAYSSRAGLPQRWTLGRVVGSALLPLSASPEARRALGASSRQGQHGSTPLEAEETLVQELSAGRAACRVRGPQAPRRRAQLPGRGPAPPLLAPPRPALPPQGPASTRPTLAWPPRPLAGHTRPTGPFSRARTRRFFGPGRFLSPPTLSDHIPSRAPPLDPRP